MSAFWTFGASVAGAAVGSTIGNSIATHGVLSTAAKIWHILSIIFWPIWGIILTIVLAGSFPDFEIPVFLTAPFVVSAVIAPSVYKLASGGAPLRGLLDYGVLTFRHDWITWVAGGASLLSALLLGPFSYVPITIAWGVIIPLRINTTRRRQEASALANYQRLAEVLFTDLDHLAPLLRVADGQQFVIAPAPVGLLSHPAGFPGLAERAWAHLGLIVERADPHAIVLRRQAPIAAVS